MGPFRVVTVGRTNRGRFRRPKIEWLFIRLAKRNVRSVALWRDASFRSTRQETLSIIRKVLPIDRHAAATSQADILQRNFVSGQSAYPHVLRRLQSNSVLIIIATFSPNLTSDAPWGREKIQNAGTTNAGTTTGEETAA